MILTDEAIGDAFRTLRRLRSMSQASLAEVSGINIKTIQRLESSGKVSSYTHRILADALSMDLWKVLRQAQRIMDARAAIMGHKLGMENTSLPVIVNACPSQSPSH